MAALVLVCIGRGERSHMDYYYYYNVAGSRPKSVLIKCLCGFQLVGSCLNTTRAADDGLTDVSEFVSSQRYPS
jgi:hypothetical protein